MDKKLRSRCTGTGRRSSKGWRDLHSGNPDRKSLHARGVKLNLHQAGSLRSLPMDILLRARPAHCGDSSAVNIFEGELGRDMEDQRDIECTRCWIGPIYNSHRPHDARAQDRRMNLRVRPEKVVNTKNPEQE